MTQVNVAEKIKEIYQEILKKGVLTKEEFDEFSKMATLLVQSGISVDIEISAELQTILQKSLQRYKVNDNTEIRERIRQERERIRQEKERARKEQERILLEQERLIERTIYKFGITESYGRETEYGEEIMYVSYEEIPEYKAAGHFWVKKTSELADKIRNCGIGEEFTHGHEKFLLLSKEI